MLYKCWWPGCRLVRTVAWGTQINIQQSKYINCYNNNMPIMHSFPRRLQVAGMQVGPDGKVEVEGRHVHLWHFYVAYWLDFGEFSKNTI